MLKKYKSLPVHEKLYVVIENLSNTTASQPFRDTKEGFTFITGHY